jgi:hypothetical protein
MAASGIAAGAAGEDAFGDPAFRARLKYLRDMSRYTRALRAHLVRRAIRTEMRRRAPRLMAAVERLIGKRR